MKQEIKEKWLAALRSGDYQQGKNSLNSNGKFCCLGVLCDLYAKEKHIEWQQGVDDRKLLFGDRNYLSATVCEWAGLIDKNPVVKEENGYRRLACLNDEGYSFAQISELIEQQL